MLSMELVLPSGKRVKVKLKKQEFDKLEAEARLYHHPKTKRTIWQWVVFIWRRKIYVAWIRVKKYVARGDRWIRGRFETLGLKAQD